VDREKFHRRYEFDAAFRVRVAKRVSRELVEGLIESAVAHGEMSVEGKSAEQIMEELRKLFPRERMRAGGFLYAIDHTGDLRALGREYVKKGKLWISVVMYATWVEHILNHLVSIGIMRRRFSDETVKQVIRDVSLPGKLLWLLPVLGFRPLHPKHRETLRVLAEKRNEFVHYKWPYREKHSDDEIRSFLSQVDKALQYLAQYKAKQTLQGRKSQIAKAARL